MACLYSLRACSFSFTYRGKKTLKTDEKAVMTSRGCIRQNLNDLHLSNDVFSIDKGFKSTHCCRLLQRKDVLCFNGNSTLICVGLKNDDLVTEQKGLVWLWLKFKIVNIILSPCHVFVPFCPPIHLSCLSFILTFSISKHCLKSEP